jgi:hypothetical protein
MSREHIKEAARAARNEALSRHRREVRSWKMLSGALMALYLATMLAVCGVILLRPKPQPSVWRTDKPPCLEPIHVVVKAFVDKRGKMRSYDNGEVIEATYWTTK